MHFNSRIRRDDTAVPNSANDNTNNNTHGTTDQTMAMCQLRHQCDTIRYQFESYAKRFSDTLRAQEELIYEQGRKQEKLQQTVRRLTSRIRLLELQREDGAGAKCEDFGATVSAAAAAAAAARRGRSQVVDSRTDSDEESGTTTPRNIPDPVQSVDDDNGAMVHAMILVRASEIVEAICHHRGRYPSAVRFMSCIYSDEDVYPHRQRLFDEVRAACLHILCDAIELVENVPTRFSDHRPCARICATWFDAI